MVREGTRRFPGRWHSPEARRLEPRHQGIPVAFPLMVAQLERLEVQEGHEARWERIQGRQRRPSDKEGDGQQFLLDAVKQLPPHPVVLLVQPPPAVHVRDAKPLRADDGDQRAG
jgi:hypothetical protein